MPSALHQNGSLSYRQANVRGEVSARLGRSHQRSAGSHQPNTSLARMLPLPSTIGSLEAMLAAAATRNPVRDMAESRRASAAGRMPSIERIEIRASSSLSASGG